MSSIRVAAVQAEPEWLDMEATTQKTIRLIDEAAAAASRSWWASAKETPARST